MSEEEYLEMHGIRCPYCRSKNIEAGKIHRDYAEITLYQNVKCNNCGHDWADRYELTGYVE